MTTAADNIRECFASLGYLDWECAQENFPDADQVPVYQLLDSLNSWSPGIIDNSVDEYVKLLRRSPRHRQVFEDLRRQSPLLARLHRLTSQLSPCSTNQCNERTSRILGTIFETDWSGISILNEEELRKAESVLQTFLAFNFSPSLDGKFLSHLAPPELCERKQNICERVVSYAIQSGEAVVMDFLEEPFRGSIFLTTEAGQRYVREHPDSLASHYAVIEKYKDEARERGGELSLGFAGLLDDYFAVVRGKDVNNAMAYWALGYALKEIRPSAASDFFERATRREPENARYHFDLARACRDDGNLLAALAVFQGAYDLNPAATSIVEGIALTAYDMRHYDLAALAFSSIVKEGRTSGLLYAAKSFANLGDYIEAEKILDYKWAITPRNADNAFLVGDAYWNIGAYDKAQACYGHVFSVSGLSLNWGAASSRLERWEDAVDYFFDTLAWDPNDFETHFRLGDVFLRQGNYDDAIWILERGLYLAKLHDPPDEDPFLDEAPSLLDKAYAAVFAE